MNTSCRVTSIFSYCLLLAALLLAAPLSAVAHGAHPASSRAPQMGVESMPKMDHGNMPAVNHGSMQGGSPTLHARSPDYSDGISYNSMKGMDMDDNALVGMLLIDKLETFSSHHARSQSWEAQGWYGNDANKLWFRTEGERSRGKLEEGDIEVFWSHSIAPFWSTQLGGRHDIGEGPQRSWAAFGLQGLAPYWFELEATGYVGPSGRTAARLRAEYELLFTQRLILQPEAEINLYSKNDPARQIGSGFSDIQLGLRLRYEIRRQFAPYIGINWGRRIGNTADYACQNHQPVFDQQLVFGIRLWF